MKSIAPLLCTLAVALLPATAAAHELEATVTLASPAVIIRAAYGGTEPVAFAKVKVFSPASGSAEFQTGLTDRRGTFAFVPEISGEWRVSLDDEEGHRREISVTVPSPFQSTATAAAATSASSRFERALLGLALMFGATGLLYGVKSRRRS